MKKIMITLAGALMTLAAHAQTVLLVETETGSTQYVVGKNAEISLWGLPDGEEENGDLTLTVELDDMFRPNFTMLATCSEAMEDVGFCITETEQQVPEYTSETTTYGNDYTLHYSEKTPYLSLKERRGNYFLGQIDAVSDGHTYYLKPYAVINGQLTFGSEKSITIPWSVSSLLSEQDGWYSGTQLQAVDSRKAEYIAPTAEAWKNLGNKYGEYLGGEPSENVKALLTTEWFRHLTPAEADLMKAHSVAYHECKEGDLYLVDKVCDDLIPTLLKAVGNIDLTQPNDKYTRSCTLEAVECDASWDIEGNKYVKTTPIDSTTNPQIAYHLPFMLLPNRIYHVSVTIAPNTEDAEEAAPNKFRIDTYQYQEGRIRMKSTKIANPVTSTEEANDYNFIYGGKTLDTFTFPIDTHDSKFETTCMLQFQGNTTTEECSSGTYSNVLRIAKVTISSVQEDAVPGDVDMDGTLDLTDVLSVAAVVVLNSENGEDTAGEKPATDFTGDGKTLIDDAVALVNYIQTGEFKPTSSKARVRREAAAAAPAFTTAKTFSVTAGENTTLSVDMSGMADYTAVSFDIKVPQGVRVAIDQNGKPLIALGSLAAATHHVSAAMQEDGQTISVACFADDNASFVQNAGSMLTVDLTADTSIATTTGAQISLSNGMATQRTLTSALLGEYLINAGIANGIEDIDETDGANAPTIVAYYNINGIQMSSPQKGINLVKMSDGSMRKVLFK